MEIVEFNGWLRNVRLSNDQVELIITQDVGPRIARFGFVGEQNLFAEIEGHQGGTGEDEWLLRGGHRLWAAPEVKPDTYELDNSPVQIEEIEGGVRTRQDVGPLTGLLKTMDIGLASDSNQVTILHTLQNANQKPVKVAPWSLSVMAPGGMCVIPLPPKIAHPDRLTHNQEWSLWGYTDMSDSRWTWGSRYVFFEQDENKGPAKIGMAHREGWVGYLLGEFLLVKRFEWLTGAEYPDGGVNFETFSNEEMLEVESLGALKTLEPDESVSHEEQWELYRHVPRIDTEDDVDKHVMPIVS